MDICELLKHYRKQSGMTQEEVAKKVYIDRTTYSGYETGKRKVETDMFFQLLDVFEVEISLTEKTQYEWVLSFPYEEDDEKEEVIISLYEEDGLYDMDVFSAETSELVFSGSDYVRQGTRFELDSIKYFIEHDIQRNYQINDIIFETFESLPTSIQTKGKNYSISISRAKHIIQKMLFYKFNEKFPSTLYYEYGDVSFHVDEEEKNKNIIQTLFLEQDKYDEDDFEIYLGKIFLEQIFNKKIKRIMQDHDFDDVLHLTFK